jgi:uncharacterized hydrophobic protein (TIGR00271 family)
MDEPSLNDQNSKEVWQNVKQLASYFKNFVLGIIDLSHGVDKAAAISEISTNKSMAGANAWMLMASIMIASLGLDLNSPAVIIGAMLISPLMAPILGLGLGAGINDREIIKKSLFHFGVALFIALATSTIYFALTPFGKITHEIASRTEPTTLDMLIAFFGGIAGIISYARKDISTTLPGVAIATALMPPLCVTGFGIASGQWDVALSSFYLFFINTFFITVATYIMVRFLRFPYRRYVNKKERLRNTIFTFIFTLVVAVPGFLILRSVLHKENVQQTIETFINEFIAEDKIYLDNYTTGFIDSTNYLILKVYGDRINNEDIPLYKEGLNELGLEQWSIKIISTSEVDLNRVTSIEDKLNGIEKLTAQFEIINKEKEEQKQVIDILESTLSGLQLDSSAFHQVCLELRTLHPDIKNVRFGNVQSSDFNEYREKTAILLLSWEGKRDKFTDQKEVQIKEFIKTRLQLDELILLPE